MSHHKTWVEVDAAAVRHNFNVAQKIAGNAVSVMAIVKANAYGHGLREVANILTAEPDKSESKNSDSLNRKRDFRISGGLTSDLWFGVDSIEEALILRKDHKKNPILILGYVPKPSIADAVKKNISMALYDSDTLLSIAEAAKRVKKKARVHLKIETGTYRQGIFPDNMPEFITLLIRQKKYIEVEGVYTHFSDTENLSSRYYKEQLQQFEQARAMLSAAHIHPAHVHTAASASLLLYPETRFTMVRWGVGLYGMYPSEEVRDRVGKSALLKPVITWKTRIVQIKDVPKGGTVGYDRTYTAKKPIKLAILPVGYGDGYWRHLSNKGTVLVRGERAQVAGNICMNICMVDVTHIPKACIGDEVVLMGKQKREHITPEEIARKVGSINYEVPTRISPRILRVAEISTRINPDITRTVV